jgi:hypothetical protein
VTHPSDPAKPLFLSGLEKEPLTYALGSWNNQFGLSSWVPNLKAMTRNYPPIPPILAVELLI